jgi:DNA-binding beta-propeller fold protein YncE
MTRRRNSIVGAALLAALGVLAVSERVLERTAAAQAKDMVQAPKFEVDPAFPKPLPNNWLLGQAIGVGVDAQDHVWIVHRQDSLSANETAAEQNPPAGSCCRRAPPILEFDQQGNLLRHWGGPGQGYDWPNSNHGITIDYKGNVWIGGNVGSDAHVLKFTQDGKFIAQFGKPATTENGAKALAPQGAPSWGSNNTENFGRVAKIFVDPKENEAYIADGYGNKRVAVIDADTGKFKRYWGAYGNKPDDTNFGNYNPDAPPLQQFRSPVHCAELSNDGFVYVCDRPNDRIQVFTREGKFVKEQWVAKRTLGDGSTWDIAFSKDPQQKYIFLADGKNEKVYIMLRDTLEIVSSFGDGGRQPGQFFAVHSIAIDSKGNLYTTETYEGRRLQKFVYKGIANVPRDQGVVWPGK